MSSFTDQLVAKRVMCVGDWEGTAIASVDITYYPTGVVMGAIDNRIFIDDDDLVTSGNPFASAGGGPMGFAETAVGGAGNVALYDGTGVAIVDADFGHAYRACVFERYPNGDPNFTSGDRFGAAPFVTATPNGLNCFIESIVFNRAGVASDDTEVRIKAYADDATVLFGIDLEGLAVDVNGRNIPLNMYVDGGFSVLVNTGTTPAPPSFIITYYLIGHARQEG